MIDPFREYIKEQKLLTAEQKVLVAVSGGIDSVIMLDLMLDAGFHCAVAHCNFQLRDQESDRDELFVTDLCQRLDTDLHSKRFRTEEYARENSISTQMAARDLRYAWFEELRTQKGFDLIATAHNVDDVIETFFINLTRGTGIRGLSGIKAKTGNIIRPLLFASRDDIVSYAREKNLSFREDSSNATVKYTRNKLRHEIIPKLQEINPDLRKGLMATIQRLRETESIYTREIENKKKDILRHKGSDTLINIDQLCQLNDYRTYLFEMLAAYNFNASTVNDIEKSLHSLPGKQFFSDSYRLVKDREFLIISPLEQQEIRKYYLDEGIPSIDQPVAMELMTMNRTDQFQIPADRQTACLDSSRLIFPLILRKWHAGDHFYPLGLGHLKKVSDFFIDEKFSLPQKENTWLLLSGENIVWIVGYRIDDRYKIREDTRKIFIAKIKT